MCLIVFNFLNLKFKIFNRAYSSTGLSVGFAFRRLGVQIPLGPPLGRVIVLGVNYLGQYD